MIFTYDIYQILNGNVSVMVSVLAIDTIDRGRVIPLKTIKLVFDASPSSTQQ